MNSRDYWAQREAEALKHYITDEAEYDRHIQAIYANMLDNVQKEIDSFYARYASAEGITLAEAKHRVSQADIAAYERKAERYVREKNFSAQANEEMRLYNAMMRINRLEMLKANIGLETIAGHDELEKYMAGILQGRTMEELERQAGILGKTIRNNAAKANAIVNGSFKNGTFSDRIWQYQDAMREDLGKLLQTGLIQGKNPRALASDLRKYWYGNDPRTGGGARYCMERLMRTELARVQTEAQKQSFRRNGFDKYLFIVNAKCCDVCAELAKKDVGFGKGVFLVEDMMPGDNAPPVHPHCRCSTAAYEDDDEYEAWLDHLANGGTTAEWERIKKSENVEKVNYSGKVTPEIESAYEDVLAKMPTAHRELAETRISGIEITDSKVSNSYNKRTHKMKLSANHSANDIIHEYAHALENAVDAYNDPKFLKILENGLENVTIADIIEDEDTFMVPIYRIESPKFVSKYQGRLYEGFYMGGDSFTLSTMYDYFAEGYEAYIFYPQKLQERDPELFEYFRGLA